VDALARALFDLSPAGIILFRPVFDAQQGLIDFAYDQLNKPAQQLLGLPQQPAQTLRQLYPETETTGIFAFYRDTFLSGQAAYYGTAYPYDGLDAYYQLAAQRADEQLVVTFTSTVGQPPGNVAAALQLSYQPALPARAEVAPLPEALPAPDAAAVRPQQRTQPPTEQQMLLSLILGQVPAAIATLSGPEHRFSFANAQYQQLVGQRAELGKSVAEVMPELVEQGIISLLDQVYTSGEPFVGTEITLMLTQPNGLPTQHYFNFVYQPLLDGKGKTQGILVFVLEVTEQVRTRRQADTLQAALLAVARRQAHERLELLHIFEQAPVAVALLREPGHQFDYFNTLFEEFFPGAQLGLTVAEAFPEADTAATIARLDHVYQTGETYHAVEVLAPGSAPEAARYVTLTYQAYREEDSIVGVAVFLYEVTAQVLARQQREAQQAELQRIFEQAPVAIGIMRGPELVVELANAALSAIWGRPLGQTLRRPYFEAVPDTAGQGFEKLLAGVLATGEPLFITAAPVTLDRAHADLPIQAYVDFVFQPLYTDGPTPTGLIAIGTEVTTQVLARQQVQALNAELTASNHQLTRTNSELDSFVYTASHDLKAPIANLEGLLAVLRQDLPADLAAIPRVGRVLGLMDGAISRFQQTIGHLTDVARLNQDDDAPTEQVDLAALIENVRLDLAPELAETAAQLTVEVSACPPVQFAPPHLRSIVYNLLSNALRYRAPGRVPEVHLRATCASGQLVLAVQDNGLGLSAEQQSKLFRLFKRLHPHVQGSGVGLYAVKKVVENAGGTITVQSEAGVGSTFTVTLPLAPASAPGR
jgi:signal transduction histidine kinase